MNFMQGGAVVARVAHNHEVVGANPAPATISDAGIHEPDPAAAAQPHRRGVPTSCRATRGVNPAIHFAAQRRTALRPLHIGAGGWAFPPFAHLIRRPSGRCLPVN